MTIRFITASEQVLLPPGTSDSSALEGIKAILERLSAANKAIYDSIVQSPAFTASTAPSRKQPDSFLLTIQCDNAEKKSFRLLITKDDNSKLFPPPSASSSSTSRRDTAPAALGEPRAAASEIPPPPGIINGGRNICFINAAFHFIMNSPALRKAIIETLRQLNLSQLPPELAIGYGRFLHFAERYNDPKTKTLEETSDLRLLLKDRARETLALGDAAEVIHAVVGPVDRAIYSNLYFPQIIEKRFTLCSHDEQAALRPQLENIKAKAKWQDGFSVLPEGVLRTDEPSFCFKLTIPDQKEALNGEALLFRQFSGATEPEATPERVKFFASPAAKEKGELSLYKPVASKVELTAPPAEGFMIELARFNSSGRKIETPVVMPEEMTIRGQPYVLKSAVVHLPGHYVALVHRSTWSYCDDSSVTDASAHQIELAKRFGYLYWYDKKI